MGLSVYKRHTSACGKKSRFFKRCPCPVWVQGTLGGEKIRKSLDLTSLDAAQTLVQRWKDAGKIGTEGLKPKTVAEAVESFLADCEARQLAEATSMLYRRFLEGHFLPWCKLAGHSELRRVTVDVVRKYRESWKWAPVTAARRLERLRTFFSFCVDSGWVEKNPAKVLKPPVVKATSKMPFTKDEVERIIDACDRLVTRGTYGKENNARVRAFVLILRYTGLRISDAARLDTSRVRDGKVFLRTEKTGTLVWVPIPEFVQDALDAVPRHGEFYFQTGNAEEKTVRGSWDRTLRIVFKLAGVNHGSAHVFRHTLATDMLSKGIPVETVAAILGHSPAICLKHYLPWVRARQEALESAVRSLWEEPKPRLKVIQGGA